jgi:hypothetical protein
MNARLGEHSSRPLTAPRVTIGVDNCPGEPAISPSFKIDLCKSFQRAIGIPLQGIDPVL